MPLSNRWTDDRGSSSLEFVTVGLVLMVPLVYLVVAMAAIQGAVLAIEGAARQAARVFVLAPDLAQAEASAIRALEFALADHGIESDAASVTVSCAPTPANCLARRSLVTVTVDIEVALPLVPSVIVGDFPLAIPLSATATQQVSRFAGAL